MDYRINLTHAIGEIYFNEKGDVDWHLEYHFSGPDRRYNTQYEMIFVSGAKQAITDALNAFERLKYLAKEQKDNIYVSQFVGRFNVSTEPSNYGISYYKPNHHNWMFPISDERKLKEFFNNIRTINSKALVLSLQDCNKVDFQGFKKLKDLAIFIDNTCNLGPDELLASCKTDLNNSEMMLKECYDNQEKTLKEQLDNQEKILKEQYEIRKKKAFIKYAIISLIFIAILIWLNS